MRVFIGCVAVLALACGVSAGGQAKIDGKLLIGKWEPVPAADKKEKASPMVIEFQTGGKMILIAGEAGKELKAEGKYELKADQLSVELKLGDKEIKETLVIVSLTADQLVTKEGDKKPETLKRKK